MQRNSRLDLLTIGMAYIGFIGLGMTGGLIGLAWPSMKGEFGVPLDAVGILLLAGTIGYLTASFYSGTFAYRAGVGRMLIIGGSAAAIGMVATALAHSWYVLIVVYLIGGLGNGTIDAGLNAYLAQHHGARAMNWLHASFGVGVTIGPLVMTAVLSSALSWRVGYAIASGVMIVVTLLFIATYSWWRNVTAQSDAAPVQRKSILTILRMPVVLMGIVMFFVYAGLEATPGQWGYVLFTEARGVATDVAGLWVSVYWASFTVGRFFFGAIITRLNTLTLMRICMIAIVFGAVLLWWNPANWVGFAGLTLIGFMEAPLFPVLVSNTPKRVGVENAGNAIGFQVAGAGVGVAMLPAFAGVLANNINLTIIPPFILIASVVVIVLHELSVAQGARIDQRAAEAAGD